MPPSPNCPPDGSNVCFSLIVVAAAAARLALPQANAQGRLVRDEDTQEVFVLKPFGVAWQADDWELVLNPAASLGLPLERTTEQGAPLSAAKAVGTFTLAGNVVNGKIVTIGTRSYTGRTTVLQKETATVIAAGGATSTGNLTVTVTTLGEVIVFTVPLDSGVQTTATLIATAIAFAFSNNAVLTARYTITHPTDTLVLETKAHAANDATLNIAIAAAHGVGAVVSSVNTTAGVTTAVNEFKIGASASDSLDNLIAAITGAAGAGTLYGTGSVAHAVVTAIAGAGDTMTTTAKAYGTAGNIASTTDANGSWGAATLTGGVTGTTPVYLSQDCIVNGTSIYKATSLVPVKWFGPLAAA